MILSAIGAHPLATSLIWGASRWLVLAVPAVAILLLAVVWNYWRARINPGARSLAMALKLLGILILALCLLEPLLSSTRAKPGANLFVVLVDNSQSMKLRDRDAAKSRADQFKTLAAKPSAWLARIGQDFDLRQYSFDTQLRSQPDFDTLAFDGGASRLGASLDRLAQQYHGRPVAGIILLTDGGATDADAVERALASKDGKLPPIYPVLMGGEHPANDVNLQSVAVSQTNFEDAPVTLNTQLTASGFTGQTIAAQLVDEAGKVIDTQKARVDQDRAPLKLRFRFRPENSGVSFYRIRTAVESKIDQLDKRQADAGEATLANNTRLVAVDRGKGPYRTLYVAGRPNWEFKFLNRALKDDDQVQLVGLLRVAKREPKFNYISHAGEGSNPLFRGFKDQNSEEVEQYDQPVLVRVGATDQDELRAGFPKTADELYRYHAVILDDIESEFFTQDQMLLLKEFVGQRGGGLLMLGGTESFKNGQFDRTPIGDLLPVYCDEAPALPGNGHVALALTKEGLLEPWVRLRSDEDAEKRRLESMPPFETINTIRGIKPGATVLANAVAEGGATVPALVEQRFGKGRSAAILIGDMWRWSLHRQPNAEDDLPKAWRQTIRWLVSEVPQRASITVAPRREADDPDGAMLLSVRVRDPAYAPQDNAAVKVRITTPDGKSVDLAPEASAREAGLYEAIFVPRQAGAYRAEATAASPDGSEIAKMQAGWASDPGADEFRDLRPNRALLDRIAQTTGGQFVAPADLESFAKTLPNRHADVTEPDIRPIWHQAWVFLLAILCLALEWGIRRWKGLA